MFQAMTGFLAHFPDKGNQLICKSHNKDHMHDHQYIMDIEYH